MFRYRRHIAALPVLILVAITLGCSVEGKWSLAEVEPTAARRDFIFDSLTLQDDGTFYAEAKTGDGVETMSGKYRHEDDTLTLESHDRGTFTYGTRFISAKRLELNNYWEGQKVYARFEKQADY